MRDSSQPVVTWCTTALHARALHGAELPGATLRLLTPAEARRDGFDGTSVAVLDTRAFQTLADLVRVRERFRGPALILTTRDAMAQVLEQIGLSDDVALCDLPWPLVSHRLRLMLQRARLHLDSLTWLPDRQTFLSWLGACAPDATMTHPVSVLITDVDHFKAINDEHGHATGDRILRALAGRLEEHLSDTGALIARFGGEEIAVLVRLGEGEASALAERLLRVVRDPPLVPPLRTTISVGGATSTLPTDPQALLGQADQALYAAKAQGRDQAVHYGVMAREAMSRGEDIDVNNFEHVTRVVADRVADLIARRSRRLFETVQQEANEDALTGLPNRRYLDRLMESQFEQAQRADEALVIALIDIDHFGEINKAWGWPTGDKTLVAMAQVLRDNLRASDELARYGGEELGVVMMGTSLEQARPVLERLRQAVAAHPFTSTEGQPIELTISIGAAPRLPADGTAHEVLERTSQALLEAKRGGRDRVCVWEAS